MIPKINNRGHSFKGVTAYLAHDKDAQSTERVSWSLTGNLPTNDLEKAARVMAYTDMNADQLKREAGGSNAGRKSEAGGVYHYSLSWAIGENPDHDHQRDEALKTLERLGLSQHQYIIVGHDDTDHSHIHIVANLTHPETGRRKTPSFDKKELSKYALAYEKEHGLHCQTRLENEHKRLKGAFTKHQDQRQDYAQKVTTAYQQSDNGKAFESALSVAGLTLAQGRRGGLVLVDETGAIQKLARQIDGVKTAAIKAKLSDIDLKTLQDADKLAKQRQQARREEEKGKAEETRQPPEKSAPEKQAPAQKKRPRYNRKQEKEKRYHDIQQAKARAAKRTENAKIRAEKQQQPPPENWDRDKANQDWKDKIAQAGIDAEKQRMAEEKERPSQGKTQSKDTGKNGGDETRKKPDNRSEQQTDTSPHPPAKSYAEYLDKVRERSHQEWRQRDQLEDQLKQSYSRAKIEQDLKAAQTQADNANTLWGRSTGKHREAQEAIDAYKKTLANITQRETEARGALEKKLDAQRPKTGQQSKVPAAEPKTTPAIKPAFEKTRVSSNDNVEAMLDRAKKKANEKAHEKAQERSNTPDQSKDRGRDRGGYER